jgi:hypothetical protein
MRRSRLPRGLQLALLAGAVFAVLAGAVFAVLGGASGAAAQAPPPDSLDDGPHVYWRDASTALVFYRCRGELLSSGWLSVAGPVAFQGMCADSAVTYTLSPSAAAEPDVFDDGKRIFAVSDIHGEYEALVDLLRAAGIVGRDLSWSWEDGHLVILGDVFDRGAGVTECLWLIHRLEREAREAGGRVHFLLGNHEIMVLQSDLRYVHERYLRGISAISGVTYDDLFGPAMELGRWLRTKHVAVRINGVLFVHGGLGPEVVERGLDLSRMNEETRRAIDLRSYDLAFADMPRFLLAGDGPIWYRRYHLGTIAQPQLTTDEMDAVLGHFGASAVVVGHTEVGEIHALYGGRAYGIDVTVPDLGGLQGLLWEKGTFYRVRGDGGREVIGGRR